MLLMVYARSLLREFEAYLGNVVGLNEHYI